MEISQSTHKVPTRPPPVGAPPRSCHNTTRTPRGNFFFFNRKVWSFCSGIHGKLKILKNFFFWPRYTSHDPKVTFYCKNAKNDHFCILFSLGAIESSKIEIFCFWSEFFFKKIGFKTNFWENYIFFEWKVTRDPPKITRDPSKMTLFPPMHRVDPIFELPLTKIKDTTQQTDEKWHSDPFAKQKPCFFWSFWASLEHFLFPWTCPSPPWWKTH